MSPSIRATGLPKLRERRGVSLIEMLVVVSICALTTALVMPSITTARDNAGRRAAHQTLEGAVAATRAAALQKGKTATLTLANNTATVTVLSGVANSSVTVMGPVRFTPAFNATIEALNGSATTITYNSRGLLMPTPATPLIYRVKVGTTRDTVCVSAAGVILSRGCRL